MSHESTLAVLWLWVAAVAALLIFLYIVGTWNYDIYRKRRMKYIAPPLPFFGNVGPVFTGSLTYPQMILYFYKKAKAWKYVGLFEFMKPFILISDPELLKAVLVKYFDNFTSHRNLVFRDLDPLMGRSIQTLQGDEWRVMKQFMSPVFTPSKVKTQVSLIHECSQYSVQHIEKLLHQHKARHPNSGVMDIDLKELFTKFTINIGASITYGIKLNSYEDPENEFTASGEKVLNTFLESKSLLVAGYMLWPKIMHVLGIPLVEREVNDFLHKTVQTSIAQRKQKNGIRHDVIQYLLNMKEKDAMCDSDLSAVAFSIFAASFESVASTLFLMCYMMALHPEVQERAREEVDQVLAECEGDDLTYDDVNKLKYVEMVMSEVLRMYPPVMTVDRVCEKSCTISVSEKEPPISVEKGEMFMIPIYALHYDPEYWPNPESFDPERFNEENIRNVKPYTYMPFGSGPRLCMGQKFALVEAKLMTAKLLSKFIFSVSPKTGIPFSIKKRNFLWAAEGGYILGVSLRNK